MKTAGGSPRRLFGAPFDEDPDEGSEFAGNGGEGVRHALTESGHGADDHDGDQGGDQRIFDRRHGALVDIQRVHLQSNRSPYVVDEHFEILFKKNRATEGAGAAVEPDKAVK